MLHQIVRLYFAINPSLLLWLPDYSIRVYTSV